MSVNRNIVITVFDITVSILFSSSVYNTNVFCSHDLRVNRQIPPTRFGFSKLLGSATRFFLVAMWIFHIACIRKERILVHGLNGRNKLQVPSGLRRCIVVKAPALRAEDPRFESRWRRDFSGSSLTSDLNIGTPVATLSDAWRCRVSAVTGWSSVSILWLGEVESLIFSFYLSVSEQIRPWDILSCC